MESQERNGKLVVLDSSTSAEPHEGPYVADVIFRWEGDEYLIESRPFLVAERIEEGEEWTRVVLYERPPEDDALVAACDVEQVVDLSVLRDAVLRGDI